MKAFSQEKLLKNGGNLPPFDKMKRIPTKLTFPE